MPFVGVLDLGMDSACRAIGIAIGSGNFGCFATDDELRQIIDYTA